MNQLINVPQNPNRGLLEKGLDLIKDPSPVTKIAAVGVITIGAMVYVATKLK